VNLRGMKAVKRDYPTVRLIAIDHGRGERRGVWKAILPHVGRHRADGIELNLLLPARDAERGMGSAVDGQGCRNTSKW